jgi:hypothetical protein
VSGGTLIVNLNDSRIFLVKLHDFVAIQKFECGAMPPLRPSWFRPSLRACNSP